MSTGVMYEVQVNSEKNLSHEQVSDNNLSKNKSHQTREKINYWNF